MNKNARLWFDNVLLRIGLVRLTHYTDLMGRFNRLSEQYITLVEQRVGAKVPAYTKQGIH